LPNAERQQQRSNPCREYHKTAQNPPTEKPEKEALQSWPGQEDQSIIIAPKVRWNRAFFLLSGAFALALAPPAAVIHPQTRPPQRQPQRLSVEKKAAQTYLGRVESMLISVSKVLAIKLNPEPFPFLAPPFWDRSVTVTTTTTNTTPHLSALNFSQQACTRCTSGA
jgi:hypothetical protein